jgi:serine/threonine-protein kinase
LPPQAPAHIDKYEVQRTLGAGAMGVVYLAYDRAIDRAVAVKTIRKDLIDGQQAAGVAARFRQEAVAAGRLSHPGIVAVYDYGEDDQTAYIVMEYAQGEDLAAHAARFHPGLPEIGALMAQLLDALQYAHEAGVVHRDIKPGNILVTDRGRLKITDFGIAHLATSGLTQHGAILGTPSHMAPEQYTGGTIDHRVDLFSAGVVLYELLTGTLPFPGNTVHEVAYKICYLDPVPASQVAPGLPGAIDTILDTALAKRRDARFPSARDFAQAIAAVLPRPPAAAVTTGVVVATGAAAAPLGTAPLPLASATAEGSIAGWSTATLRALEAALVPVVGPVAGTLVRRSAARAADPTDLVTLLAASVDDPVARTRLVASLQAVLGLAPPARTASPGAPAGSVGERLRSFTKEDLDRLTQALAVLVGPIAKIFVQKAAASGGSYHDLCLRLSERLGTPEERARFLAQVGAG